MKGSKSSSLPLPNLNIYFFQLHKMGPKFCWTFCLIISQIALIYGYEERMINKTETVNITELSIITVKSQDQYLVKAGDRKYSGKQLLFFTNER